MIPFNKKSALIAFSILMASASAGASGPPLIYCSGQTTFYSGREINLQWRASPGSWKDADALHTRLVYANKIVLQQNLPPVFPLRLTFTYPELRPGVTADPVLIITATRQGETIGDPYEQQLYFFSSTTNVQTTMSASDVGVWDLTEENILTQWLEEMSVPFTPLMDIADFKGRWLICAGLDFDGRPSLFDALQSKLEQGTSILGLPPIQGSFPIPAYKKGSRLLLAGGEIVREINKIWNLDTLKDSSTQATGFRFAAQDDMAVVETTAFAEGHTWFEYRRGDSRLIFWGWDLALISQTNPSARDLFTYLLTH